MVKITYIEPTGTAHELDVPVGHSLMEGAVKNGLPGIDAECGGVGACATCHVYVDSSPDHDLGTPSVEETDMLEFAEGVKPSSRLSCQIKVTEHLSGLVVRLPDSQRQ